MTKKSFVVFSIFTFSAINCGWAQESGVDLSFYDTIYVRTMLSSDETATEEMTPEQVSNVTSYVSGLILSALRNTDRTKPISIWSEDASDGLLIDILLDDIRIAGIGRAFVGALAGRDRVAGDIRLINLATDQVVAEIGANEKGEFGTAAGNKASIYAAMEEFANAVVSWLGESVGDHGSPSHWRNIIEMSEPIALSCSGVADNSFDAFQSPLFEQTDESFCTKLAETLAFAGATIDDASSTRLSVYVESAGTPVTGAFNFETVVVTRWQILQEGGRTVLNDLTMSRFRNKKGGYKKRSRLNAETLISLNVQEGIGAIWPDAKLPEIERPK